MVVRALAILVLLSVFFSFPVMAAKCDGSGSKPEWIDSPESSTDEFFFAAGVSDNLKFSLPERRAMAKQNALTNLSGSIEISVRNSLELEQSNNRFAGHELTESSLRAITKTSTSASLRNVEIVAIWEDPQSCALWMRARVSKKNIELAKREGLAMTLFAVLTDHLTIAQDPSAVLNNRISSVDAALELLPRIAFDVVPQASSADFYNQLLNRIKKELIQSREDIDKARVTLISADQIVSIATSLNNENEKSKSLGIAAKMYKSLLVNHSNGLPPVFEPGDLIFKLGEIEELKGSSCGAKNYFLQAADSKQLNDRREIARKKSENLSCSAEDMEKTLWRQYFEGRSTTLICYFNAKTEQGAWNKACDGLNNVIRQLGADVTVRSQALSPLQIQTIRNGEIPMGLGEPGTLLLGVVALGVMKNRINNESGGSGHEFQFEGGMSTFLIDNGSTVFADRFQGTTGWNPISSQMVMDVLGINVVKRWREKFSKFLRHELN